MTDQGRAGHQPFRFTREHAEEAHMEPFEITYRKASTLMVGEEIADFGVLTYVSYFAGDDVVWVKSDRMPARSPDVWPASALAPVVIRKRLWQRTITYTTDRQSVAEAWALNTGQTECASTSGHPSSRTFGEVTEV